jgi:hypothetical protein
VFWERLVARPVLSRLCFQETAMRKWVILLAAVVGGVVGLTAVTDEAAACGRRRCLAVWYCPPPSYCYPPPGYAPFATQPALPRGVTIRGKTYYILPMGEKEVSPEAELRGKRSVFARSSGIPEPDLFDGTVRKIAKVTIFEGPTRTFGSVSELRGWLPDDNDMKDLGIGKGPDVDRVEKERLNVSLKAYIYTYLKEGDNDYHVIIGDAPGTPNRRYMNAEVSGIPDIGTDENRNQLWMVRKAFKQTFELGDEGPDRYYPLHEPVPVKITGSLFWDVEHYPKTVGPKFASPKTAWEIHPVSSIDFLD